MPRTTRPLPASRSWRAFTARDGRKIERSARAGHDPRCPGCGELLQAKPESQLSPCLILDATSYDLACRACLRYWCIIQETQRSLQLIRMRRLAAAVKGEVPPKRPRPATATDFFAVMQR